MGIGLERKRVREVVGLREGIVVRGWGGHQGMKGLGETMRLSSRSSTSYPDISQILEAKKKRRRTLAALSWEEKIAIVDIMRTQLRKELWKPIDRRQSPALSIEHPNLAEPEPNR